MAQIDNQILLGIVTLIFVVNTGGFGMLWRYMTKLKESVQYKDNCQEIVKRQDERHQEIREDLKEIKTLIRNGNTEK
jgi:hypothetical protein